MRKIFCYFFMIFSVLISLSCSTSTSINDHYNLDDSLPKNIGIQGYSPVSYFTNNSAIKGNPEYSYLYKDKLYYFTSLVQIETFKQNPEKYLPKYGEHCPYSLALGRRVGIDPNNFRVHNDELLLFHDDVELSTVDIPLQNKIIEKADEEYRILLLDF